ncbi:winged helix-turn-helix transcriptional regulator [Vibrio sonorensis]|uniref:winged helix-turn-helix transcriptional regulator n=1 Tax=Vibrio sonorensis TaxID=1004316 RepID=UPI0008DA1DFD|nr:helix-turn-helix domain-containing protein [Vibrio sonorensis]
MKRSDFSSMNCSIARSLNIFGEWWTLLIVRDLFLGNNRFNGLQKNLGISKKVLVDRLSTLLEEGVIEKCETGTNRHFYKLTEKGLALEPILLSIMQWGDKWHYENQPPIMLKHNLCGEITEPALQCTHCKQPLHFKDVTGLRGPSMSDERYQHWQDFKLWIAKNSEDA